MQMPIPVITSIISAISIISGSALGAWCSWIINNKMHKRKMEEEYNLIKDNRKYEEYFKAKELCANANIIRLDICTAIFTSLRILKRVEDNSNLSIYPVNKNYSCSVSSLIDKYTLKELSYIYQFYGILESTNNIISKLDPMTVNSTLLENYSKNILTKLYGANYNKILSLNIDFITYKDLYENEYIKEGYRSILRKLDTICSEECSIEINLR